MKIAIVAAGFTPAEADELRRSMATFKMQGQVSRFEKKLIDGMVANGYQKEFAERIYKQLEGFGSYGFPKAMPPVLRGLYLYHAMLNVIIRIYF